MSHERKARPYADARATPAKGEKPESLERHERVEMTVRAELLIRRLRERRRSDCDGVWQHAVASHRWQHIYS